MSCRIRNILQGVVLGAGFSLLFLAPLSGWGSVLQLAAIKPTLRQAEPVSDEQQAIMAVRAAKQAVVNIVGKPKGAVLSLEGGQADLSASEMVEGTGFLISSDGLVVTNSHVVEDGGLEYAVMFADGKEFAAKVLGTDRYDDIALLKIEASGLPVLRFGDSESLETGQTVFAIGNSLGQYQNSVTRGVVSGLGRSVDSARGSSQPRMQQLIQTDAAINPGNSGGPLINLAGEAVGMNTMIDTRGEGVGFAVPASLIQNVIQQLQTFGTASRPYMGLSFSTISSNFRPFANAPSQGAYVAFVVPGGPAEKAGIRRGDVITAIDGRPLTLVNELDKAVSRYQPGMQISLQVRRNQENLEFLLILENFR